MGIRWGGSYKFTLSSFLLLVLFVSVPVAKEDQGKSRG